MSSRADREAQQRAQDQQFKEWGVIVQTSNLRPVHIANGIVQLLRLAGDPPSWAIGPGFAKQYVASVKERSSRPLTLPDAAKALCVTKTKDGPLSLESATPGEPRFMVAAREHFGATLGRPLNRAEHRVLAAVINADGKVVAAAGDDPTTPGLLLAGFSTTHTLAGMHAATFLGLLCRTSEGCAALAKLYSLLADESDSQSSLLSALKLTDERGGDRAWPRAIEPVRLRNAYPLPGGDAWDVLAGVSGRLVGNLLSWNTHGISKADTLMSVIDLCALLLMLRLFLWTPSTEPAEPRLLLLLSPAQVTSQLRQAVARAQEALKRAAVALDESARSLGLETVMSEGGGRGAARDAAGARGVYLPSNHAFNLGAAGGWLFPLDGRAGAKRYLRPGPRQLMTLVRGLVQPGDELSWREFSDAAEGIGVAVGGVHEHRIAARLRLRGAAESLRRIGMANRDHLVMLGLARREADNLVIVDGGAS